MALEMFMDFINTYKLNNTKEIFLAETNYQNNQKVCQQLREEYNGENMCIGEQFIQRHLNPS